jgi:hypothetical protein
VTKVHATITDLWNKVQVIFGQLLQTAEDAWNAFSSRPFYWLTRLVAGVLLFLLGLQQMMDDKLRQVAQLASTAGKKFNDNLVSFMQALPGRVLTFLNNLLISLGKWEIEMGKKALEAGKAFLKAAVDEIGKLPTQMQDILGKVGDFIGKAVPVLIKQGTSLARQLALAFLTELQKLPAQVGALFSNLGSQIHSGLHDAHVPGFALGGVVPGAVGEARLAIVHGGERVYRPGEVPRPPVDPGNFGDGSPHGKGLNETNRLLLRMLKIMEEEVGGPGLVQAIGQAATGAAYQRSRGLR